MPQLQQYFPFREKRAFKISIRTPSPATPTTLLGLLSSILADRTASGVGRGDRVGIALPNGFPTIVRFLAASEAGTEQIHITDAIPRTATGKIQRRVVAQAFSPQPS